jgi:protein FrlC
LKGLTVINWSFSTNAFRAYSLLDTLEILRELGFAGVEIMADVPHAYPPHLSPGDIDAIRQCLRETGLEIASLNAFMLHALQDTWHPSWIEPDLEWRVQRVEYTRQCIDLAARLGAKSLSTEPGGPLVGMDRSQALEIFYDGLAAVEPRAREAGVKILIEPEPELLIETSQQFLQFVQALDPAVFGLNFDIGHFFCVGEDPVRLIEDLAPFTWHFHFEDIAASRVHRHLLPGEGAIDLAGVLKAIERTGYDGFVTIELYPYEDRPVEAAREALAYVGSL